MARFALSVLRQYLFAGCLPTTGCTRREIRQKGPVQSQFIQTLRGTRWIQTNVESVAPNFSIPFRKQLKEEAKKRKAEGKGRKSKADNQTLDRWELTVGIEIHAQLNTAKKLFSSAASTINDQPNAHVALFDLAMPGSQPLFQQETLIPAVRAALALNCDINKISRFDRKHYFHWDQPSGYQITQYYKPFATDGHITLYSHDGIAKEDGEQIHVGIKQIQIEQDTAKTISQPGDIHLLDFNRVGLPLIEIITFPQIHHPSTAAALVRKVQALLAAVDSCVLGMESGGLRADVNVSVRKREGGGGDYEYAGVKGLGQRTEIKNLSSFKAVEDAIIAERDRQIQVLECGGVIEGETRGWSIGSPETRRLRGKEGEVDYRYMPDPDLNPIVIGEDLLDHLKTTLGVLPDEELGILVDEYGLTVKDGLSLISLDHGGRVEYFRNVVDEFFVLSPQDDLQRVGKLCGNWVLHEMGGLSHISRDAENPLRITQNGECVIPSRTLAHLIHYLDHKKITGRSAKLALTALFEAGSQGVEESVGDLIERKGWWFQPLNDAEYEHIAANVIESQGAVVMEILAGKHGKVNFLLGQMMRQDQDGRIDPQRATAVLNLLIDKRRKN